MNFFVSVAVGMLVVFQAFKLMGPLPEKIQTKLNTDISVRERNMQAAMSDDFSSRTSYHQQNSRRIASTTTDAVVVVKSPEPVATPVRRWTDIKHTNKPLVTFERYIAQQKKMKKQKRVLASGTHAKKAKPAKYQAKKPVIKRQQKVASSATRV